MKLPIAFILLLSFALVSFAGDDADAMRVGKSV